MLEKVGSWAFILGVVIAIIVGVLQRGTMSSLIATLLVVLGLIIGLLNVTSGESMKFLLAAVSLVIISGLGSSLLGQVNIIGPILVSTLSALMMFLVPASVIVALKTIFSAAQD